MAGPRTGIYLKEENRPEGPENNGHPVRQTRRKRDHLDLISHLEYICSMKVKTSVTLSEEIVEELDRITGDGCNRSQMIERAVAEYLERKRRRIRETRDLEILNRSAAKLNEEIDDVLSYQVEL